MKTGKQVYQCSIVIPLLSQKNQWLDECVTSALRQTAACEVIVVTSTETPQPNMEVLQRLEVSNENLILTSCGARNFPGGTIRGNDQSGRVVKRGAVRDPETAARVSTGRTLRLPDYVPAAAATGILIERALAAGPKLVASDLKDCVTGITPDQ